MAKENLYEDLRELFENELLKITKAGEPSAASVEAAYKLLDCIKDINKICEKDMEMEHMYSEMGSQRGYGRRRSMGYPYMGSYAEGGYSNGGYGGWNSRNSSIDHLQTMVDNAKNDRERMMYQRWLDEARQLM